jgi:hypothetical protein
MDNANSREPTKIVGGKKKDEPGTGSSYL